MTTKNPDLAGMSHSDLAETILTRRTRMLDLSGRGMSQVAIKRACASVRKAVSEAQKRGAVVPLIDPGIRAASYLRALAHASMFRVAA